MRRQFWLAALCSALCTSILASASVAMAQSASGTALTPTAFELVHTQRIKPAPSAFWLVAGGVLGAGGLVLNIDSARRFDDGDPSCYPLLEPGGCLAEAFAAGPVGTLGGFSLLLYGLWLGEHDARLALAQGRPLQDHSALETWSLVGVLGGYAIAIAINIYAIARLYGDYDVGACEDASRADRAQACSGGKIFGLSIVQSAAFAIALLAAEPLGYAVGYDGVRREHQKKVRATLLPWVERDRIGLAVGLRL